MNDHDAAVVVAAINVIGRLVLPIVVLWVVYLFRAEVSALLGRVAGVKVGALELRLNEVEEKTQKVEAGIEKTKVAVVAAMSGGGPERASHVAAALEAPPLKRILEWAAARGVQNPWDMGPRNWERCLFDLGAPGGVKHALHFDEGGKKLMYQ